MLARWLTLVTAVLLPGSVWAQGDQHVWPSLDPSKLQTVYVMDDAGLVTKGRLLSIDPEALVLLVGEDEQRFEAERIRRIDVHARSMRKGALIGAGIGVGMGGIAAGISDCPGADPGGRCPGFRTVAFLGSIGAYAAIGAGINALFPGRTTLYVASEAPPTGARAGAAPRLAARRVIGVTFQW